MQYTDLIASLTGEKTPALLTTATTGLKEEDELIAAFTITGNQETELLMRSLPTEKLSPASVFHGIGPQEVRSFGQPDDLVRSQLDELFAHHSVFSYNPEFQTDFLSRFGDGQYVVHDLPLILQAADMRVPLCEVRTLSELESEASRLVGKPPSFKSICRRYSIAPRELLLPLQSACWQLRGLWARLAEIPVVR